MAAVRALLLDGGGYQRAPFRPRPVVVAHVLVAEEVRQYEPGVSGALSDAAVGDDVFVRRDTLTLVELRELVGRLEGAIFVHCLRPDDVLRSGDVSAALRPFLR